METVAVAESVCAVVPRVSDDFDGLDASSEEGFFVPNAGGANTGDGGDDGGRCPLVEARGSSGGSPSSSSPPEALWFSSSSAESSSMSSTSESRPSSLS
jgi:hypothetical protein